MLLAISLVFCAISLFGVKVKREGIFPEYLSMEQSTAIRGIFAVIILLSHMNQYLVLESAPDKLEASIIAHIGQLMVAPFFFYSGYGITLSYAKKKDYVRGFARKRIGKTWFHFACAILLYLALNMALNVRLDFKRAALAFTGWTSIGNSNWYICDMLLLYIVTYGIFLALRRCEAWSTERRTEAFVWMSIVSTILLAIGLARIQPTRWYNTLLCYPLGCLYAYKKDALDRRCSKQRESYWLAAMGVAVLFIAVYPLRKTDHLFAHNIVSCLFVILVCCLMTMKIRICNPVLVWLGKYSFYTYIYMRIPMIVLSKLGLNASVTLFSLPTIAITLGLAFCLGKLQALIDHLVFNRRGAQR